MVKKSKQFWDFLAKIQEHLPLFLIAPTVFLVLIITSIGFCKRGILFFKYGFGKLPELPFDIATKKDIERIETNHFAHL
ncbi:hypothetical protein FACS1894200_04500 [Spirochaetia bacterium]|nr:hypothetical protein FACS1894200_04500 [Spirochaetia bacterium]